MKVERLKSDLKDMVQKAADYKSKKGYDTFYWALEMQAFGAWKLLQSITE